MYPALADILIAIVLLCLQTELLHHSPYVAERGRCVVKGSLGAWFACTFLLAVSCLHCGSGLEMWEGFGLVGQGNGSG
jgi:hypothetical protein